MTTFESPSPYDLARSGAGEPPTRVRFGVVGFSITMAVILYLDRMAFSVAMPAIATDLDLSLREIGWAVSAFFWCYALFQVPCGWMGDRWGGRRALALYVVAWSLATAGLGLARGTLSLVTMRALLGIGQAGAYATAASMLRRWIPFPSRGVANSLVSLGGRAGGVIAPALTAALMHMVALTTTASGAWRPVFITYGAVGLVWALLFRAWFRDSPREHAACNTAEIELIESSEPATLAGRDASSVEGAAGGIPLRALLGSRSLWFLALENFLVNVGWIFVGTWLPTFLIRELGWTELSAGPAASMTAGAGMAGCLCGGIATDWLARRLGLRWGRRVPGLISCGGAALGYASCWLLTDRSAILAVLVVSSFLGDFALGAMWSTCQDIGRRYAGTVLGTANMCGNFGAAGASSLIAALAEESQWSTVFAVSAAAYTGAAVSWTLIDPCQPLRISEETTELA